MAFLKLNQALKIKNIKRLEQAGGILQQSHKVGSGKSEVGIEVLLAYIPVFALSVLANASGSRHK